MKTTKITCFQCGKSFERKSSRVKIDLKQGRRLFCSLSCNRIQQNKERTDYGCLRDNLSPFRYYFKSSQRHAKKKNVEFSITLQDLKEQWQLQEGICTYSRRKMTLHSTTTEYQRSKLTPSTASLDRILPAKGYVANNIQWVCIMAQYAKNIFTEQELLEFCKDVAFQRS